MRPDELNSGQGETSSVTPQQQAAARLVRTQIDTIYENNANLNPSQQQSENTSPYQKTHSDYTDIHENQWKQYHTAWQNYYQKYYEGYYTHHLQKAQHTLKEQMENSHFRKNQGYFGSQSSAQPEPDETQSKDEALFDLRQKLIGKVQESAVKIKKSRHFIPILAGIIAVVIFLFLQYNRVLISNVTAYVSPGSIDPQNIVIDPNADIIVGSSPRLIIPKINVDVPVIYDIGNDYESQMTAMNDGVAQFAIPGASSHPGQVGNTVIAGHSSNDLFDSGDYKFIFAQLDKLIVGDTIYANYQSKRYTYTVTKKEVVKPNEVDKLAYPTTKPILTLITCTPLGTSINRLLVTAEQINPDPNLSTAAPKQSDEELNNISIPGNSPTLLERIFGTRN